MPEIVNIGTPTSPTIYTKKYGSFRGVDFSQSETMVDDNRSPHAVNVISDTGGFPEKRLGWRTLQTLDGRINGIYHYKGLVTQKAEAEGEEDTETIVDCFIIHAGTKIYSWSGTSEDAPTELLSGINDARSTGRCFRERLFILTGAELLEYDGKTCVEVFDGEASYVPTTWQGRAEAYLYGEKGMWYGGTMGKAYQEVNIACQKRKNMFRIISDERSYRYLFLDGKIKAGTRMKMTYIPTGQVIFDITAPKEEGWADCEVGNSLFDWESMLNYLPARIHVSLSEGDSESRKIAGDLGIEHGGVIRGVILTSNTPGFERPAEGESNYCIEYVAEVGKSEGAISGCTVMDVFENRIFYSGNPEFPNTDWHSELNEPTYVRDLSYTEIGLDATPVTGYLHTGNEQAILKDDNDGATIYMRYRAEDAEGNVLFPIRQGTSGIGAVARNAVCTMLDDPLYLSRNGVYAIAQQDISSERALNIRSTRINKKLLKNTNLEDAYMCTWKGNLMLFINGDCYVADAAQKTYAGNKTGTFEYEWYYWTNIPARVALEYNGVLYFGTEDGRLCRFNDDMKNSRGEIASSAYSDDGEPIIAEWATNLSDDGDFMRLKTMKKKGSGVMLKTYNRSGVKVCIKTDRDFEREIREKSAGIFNFEDLDFNDFTFNTSEYTVVPFNAKFKKYKAIQVICRNDKVNQAFGVLGIIRRYVTGNFAK
ncbi:MAG: hypothetical protein IJF32_05810 [Oscillospiraceae bacterium]|nr:hypothetical protein [Oscillospiraceae bacterium]